MCTRLQKKFRYPIDSHDLHDLSQFLGINRVPWYEQIKKNRAHLASFDLCEIIDDDEDTEPKPVRNTINTPMSSKEG